MKSRKCDLCRLQAEIPANTGVSFGRFDLCGPCTNLVRRAVCLKCKGTGRMRVRDDEATFAQASCGENRTQYTTIMCDLC